jgi:dTDP-4-dehydrorhamnose 3,5-epimerase
VTASPRDPQFGLAGGTPFDGVRVAPLAPTTDERGSFTEVYSDDWDTGIDPVQWSVVRSDAGVLRGMHLHDRHVEYLMVVAGRVSIGLHDARPGSPTEGRWCRLELAGDEPAFVTFPAGIVHGWLFHEPSTHLQAVSETYASYADDDNHGCHWSDPALGIEWPFEPTVVSARADGFPPLAELLARRAIRPRA